MDKIVLVGDKFFRPDGEGVRSWDGDPALTPDEPKDAMGKVLGGEWIAETLYMTTKKNYVIARFYAPDSDKPASYKEIEESDAVMWLVRQGQDVPNELATVLQNIEL